MNDFRFVLGILFDPLDAAGCAFVRLILYAWLVLDVTLEGFWFLGGAAIVEAKCTQT